MERPLPKVGKIEVRVDRVYGKVVTYPLCERAKLLAEIAGTKTLTEETLRLADRMGFVVVARDMSTAYLAALS